MLRRRRIALFPLSSSLISLEEARIALAGSRVWALTDGKMGDLVQCLGVAERLGLEAESRVVRPRRLPALFMPYGPIDPAEAPGKPGSPLAPPFPDIAIASGRRAVAYLRHLGRISAGRTTTLFLKDPRISPRGFDLVWRPDHDRLSGGNVLATLTSPHRFSPERLGEAAASPPPWGSNGLSTVAVLLGGTSKDFRFTDRDIAAFRANLAATIAEGAFLVVTPSRRTPPDLHRAVASLLQEMGGWFWDGRGDNPYPAMLARAEAFIVTSESVNMVGEAAATGRPIHLVRPTGQSRKIDQFLKGLEQAGAVRPFRGRIERFTYDPIDSTPWIARALAACHLEKRRQGRPM